MRAACYESFLALLWIYAICLIVPLPSMAQGPRIKVALFIDDGASDTSKKIFRKELENSNDIDCKCLYGADIRNGALKNFDALVIPGGSANKEAASMGAEAREEVRRFVKEGGIYMGVCAGAYLSSQARDTYLGMLPLTTLDQKHWYRVDDGTPVDVELTPTGMEVFGVTKRNIRIVYENGPIFAAPDGKPDDTYMPLGFFRSEVVGDGGQPGVMRGAPAMILSRYGRGIVLAISPHPEKTPGLKQVELNALRWLYNHRTAKVSFMKTESPMILARFAGRG